MSQEQYSLLICCFSNLSRDTLLGSAEMERYYNEEREEYFIEATRRSLLPVLRFYTHDKEIYCPPCCSKFLFEASQYLTLAVLKHFTRISKIMARPGTLCVPLGSANPHHILYSPQNNCQKLYK